MTEILYCPKNNEIFLFSGQYKVDVSTNTITAYIQGKAKSKAIKKISIHDLYHIGWL